MKKLLSLLLTACLLVSCALPATAAEKSCGCDKAPIIVVCGVGAFPLMENAGTENESVYFPPTVNVGKIVFRAVGGTFLSMVTLDIRYIANAAADIALDILGKLGCNEKGEPAYPISAVAMDEAMSEYDPSVYMDAPDSELAIATAAVQAVGADHTYVYNYDWRLNPMTNVDKMDAFIKKVCRETGHEKVRLAACSMGGAQTVAYFQKYGHEKVDTVWMLSSAFSGLWFVTNLFAGDFVLDQGNVFKWLKTMETGKPGLDKFLGRFYDFCGTTALLKPLFSFLQSSSGPLNEVAIERVFKPTILSMPGMWAFVRDERYEEGKKTMLSDAGPAFLELLDDYHYNVFVHREEILKSAAEDGVKIHIISHYNNGNVPITSTGNYHGDNLIETVCTSGGATVAPYDETLGDGYCQKSCKVHNHLSSDGVIDASTGMFPDSTWFVRNMAHVGAKKDSQYNTMLCWLFSQTEQVTVFDNPDYPQFLTTDGATMMTLEPLQ